MTDPFVVIDVETTGLKAKDESILEIAVVIADPHTLEVTDHFSSLVIPDMPISAIYDRAIPLIQEMHTKNNLWVDLSANVGNVECLAPAVQMRLVGWLTDMMLKYNFVRPPMMGSSVQLDREFIEVHMPTVFELFHYRNIDVSTLKEIFSRRNPTIFACGPKEQPAADQPHRALQDCLETLAEYGHYERNLFVAAEVTA